MYRNLFYGSLLVESEGGGCAFAGEFSNSFPLSRERSRGNNARSPPRDNSKFKRQFISCSTLNCQAINMYQKRVRDWGLCNPIIFAVAVEVVGKW